MSRCGVGVEVSQSPLSWRSSDRLLSPVTVKMRFWPVSSRKRYWFD